MLWIGYTSIIRPIVYFRSSRKWKRGFGAEMKNCSTWNWHNKIIYASNTTFILLLTCWLLRKNQSTVPRYGSINSQNKSARQYPAYRAISNPLIVFVFSVHRLVAFAYLMASLFHDPLDSRGPLPAPTKSAPLAKIMPFGSTGARKCSRENTQLSSGFRGISSPPIS